MRTEQAVKKSKKEKRLPEVFRRKLFKVTAVILLISIVFIALIISLVQNISVLLILSSEQSDMLAEIDYESERFFGSMQYYWTDFGSDLDEKHLAGMAQMVKASHWWYVDNSGKVVFSDDKTKVNTAVQGDPILSVFWDELATQSVGEFSIWDISEDDFLAQSWAKHVGISLGTDGMVVLEYLPEQYYDEMDVATKSICNFKSVGNDGFNFIIHRDGSISSPPADIRVQKDISMSNIDVGKMLSLAPQSTLFQINLNGTDYCAIYAKADGYYVISLISRNEVMYSLYVVVIAAAVLVILLMVIIFLRVNDLTKRLIVNNIGKINSELSEITGGNLDVEIDVKDNLEFRQLSDGINTTVSSLKGYIARESEQFNKELELARAIQTSALPNVFPPFPNRHDIDVYASMNPAKEVGGDFYDFFFINSTRFAFLIADVSDKGIPAAMFMMRAKTTIKSLAQANRSVEEIIRIANNALCENNEADMFVTLWFGILDTADGTVSYINAGHCKPLIRRAGGEFAYLDGKPDFVVAGEESIRFRRRELHLCRGDALFLYTDGVTEAFNTGGELYGEERLLQALNAQPCENATAVCETVFNDVRSYSNGATQTDDLTMLAVVFNGERLYREITVDATEEGLEKISAFVEKQMLNARFDFGAVSQTGVIADEIGSNIVRYAYPNRDDGTIKVAYSFDFETDEAEITFTDSGVPFNPLNAPDPDPETTEDGEEGGLGIFLVKRYSDKVLYEHVNDQNVLTIIKKRKENQ